MHIYIGTWLYLYLIFHIHYNLITSYCNRKKIISNQTMKTIPYQ